MSQINQMNQPNQINQDQQIDPIQLSSQIIGSITKQVGILGNIIEQLTQQLIFLQQNSQQNGQSKFIEPSALK